MSNLYETRISQVPSEFEAWLDILKRCNVRRYLEIGSRFGGSLWAASRVMPKRSRIVAVDSGKGMGGGKPGALDSLRSCIDRLKSQKFDAHFVKGHSQSASVISAVAALGPFDAVFIDGDHEYAGVRMDWRIYGQMAPIVGFHDVAWEKPEGYAPGAKVVEVPQFWSELKAQHRHDEFVDKSDGRTMGIGVIWRD